MAEGGILAGTAFINVLPKMAAFQSSVAKGLKGLEKKTEAAGKSLTRNVTLPLVAAGGASVHLALDFNETFDQMVGLAGVSRKEIAGLKDEVLKLAPAFGKDPRELAKALYFIESSGVKGKKALDALRVSAKLSAAGLGETETVADAVTSAMNAYASSNLTASQAGDVLAQAVADGKGEASQIAPVLGSILPLSSRLGVSFDQVAAAISSMTLTGSTAPEAGTQLSGFFTSLLSNSPKVVKALKSVGLTTSGLQADLKDPKKGLLYVTQELSKAYGGNVNAMRKAFPNIRGLRGLLSLTGDNAKKTAGVFNDLAHSTGATKHAWDAVSKDEQFKFKQLTANVQALGVRIGNVLIPWLLKAADYVKRLISWYQHLNAGQKDNINHLVVFAAVAGPALVILSKFIKLLRFIGNTFKDVGKGIRGMAKGVGWIRKNLPEGINKAQRAFRTLAANARKAANAVVESGKKMVRAAKFTGKAFVNVGKAMGRAASAALGYAKAGAKVIWSLVKQGAALVKSAALWVADRAVKLASTAATYAMAAAQWALNVAMEANPIGLIIAGLIALGIAFVVLYKKSGTFRRIVLGVLHAVQRGVSIMVSFVRRHWRILAAILLAPIAPLILVATHFDTFKRVVRTVVSGVKSLLNGLVGFITGLPDRFIRGTKNLWGWLTTGLKSAANAAIGLINMAIGKINSLGIHIHKHIFGQGVDFDWSPSIPTISYLAKGGIVTGPTLSMVGEAGPEAVIPLSHGASGPGMALTITNWETGTGYFEFLADGRVGSAAGLTRQRGRMRRA